MPDIEYVCKDCNQTFVFSEGEQKYYQDRGLAIPKRCARCRLRRRSALARSTVKTPEPEEAEGKEKKEKKEKKSEK